VTAVLNQLLLIDNIAEQAFEVSQNWWKSNQFSFLMCWQANATFYGIPCDIMDQIQEPARGLTLVQPYLPEPFSGFCHMNKHWLEF